jgi:hypothetical protein
VLSNLSNIVRKHWTTIQKHHYCAKCSINKWPSSVSIKVRLTNDLPQGLSKLTLIDTEEGHLLIENVVNIFFVTMIDTEEGHLLIENFVNIFFITFLSVSLQNLLDFYNLFCLCCIVKSRRSLTH